MADHPALPTVAVDDCPQAADISLTSFKLFSNLPAEIRLTIWEQALATARTVWLRFDPKVRCANRRQVHTLDPVRALRRVCRESHAVADRHARSLASSSRDLHAALADLRLNGLHVAPDRDVLFLDGFHAWLQGAMDRAMATRGPAYTMTNVSDALAGLTASLPFAPLLTAARRVLLRADDVAAAASLFCLSGAAAFATFQHYEFLGMLLGAGAQVEEYVVMLEEAAGKGHDGQECDADLGLEWPDMVPSVDDPDQKAVEAVGRSAAVADAISSRCRCPQRFTGDGAWIQVLQHCWEGWTQDAIQQKSPFPKLLFATVQARDGLLAVK